MAKKGKKEAPKEAPAQEEVMVNDFVPEKMDKDPLGFLVAPKVCVLRGFSTCSISCCMPSPLECKSPWCNRHVMLSHTTHSRN